MIVMGIDPSSTCTGYAVMSDDGLLIDVGRLRPRLDAAPPPERILAMIAELPGLIREHQPAIVVVEMPSGKVAGRIAWRHPSGLAVYGFAAGAIWHAIVGLVGGLCVVMVNELVWTRSVPKAIRIQRIAAEYPAYAEIIGDGEDSGGDAGDAIGLAQWYFGQMRVAHATTVG
jgi:hypothetical protein